MIVEEQNIHHIKETDDKTAQARLLLERYDSARRHRNNWQNLWDECYEFALPERAGRYIAGPRGRGVGNKRLYDATAMDAADQLAASLLGHLTPGWSQWFGLTPGPDLSPQEAEALTPVLEEAARTVQAHFDRSNFAVEIHQCYLDLVVGGTASLFFEETEPGSFSAFTFQAVPLYDSVLEEGAGGLLDGIFRRVDLTLDQLSARYPAADIPVDVLKESARDPQARFEMLESVLPDGLQYAYTALLIRDSGDPVILQSGRFSDSPAISFRWSKSPGEIYGRSPVMKALPDIKTANKVVELILKNASIAVTGIWQADDDGILNPANIKLVPGAIIPKAIDSKGLQPLQMPGRFDVSQLMLDNLQARVRHALMADTLLPATGAKMTATEVLERSAQNALILGATYGRLQSELLTPLIKRAFAILRRRGDVPDIALDGRFVSIEYRSPLARAQGQRNVQNTLNWISSVLAMGPEAALSVDIPQAARYLGEAMAVPRNLIRNDILPPVVQTEEVPQEQP